MEIRFQGGIGILRRKNDQASPPPGLNLKVKNMTVQEIKANMKKYGFRSQSALGEAVGLSKTSISKILSGKVPLSARNKALFEYLFEAEALYQENQELRNRLVELTARMANAKAQPA